MGQVVDRDRLTVSAEGVEYEVIDSDGHVEDTGEDLFRYLEPPYAGHLQLKKRFDTFVPALDGWNRLATLIEVDAARGRLDPKGGQPSVDSNAWLGFLDQTQITRTVLYPSDMLRFGAVRGTAWARAVARAYNNYLHAEFTSRSDRIDGMALIPVQDGEAAAEELERAVRQLGMVGGVLTVSGMKRQLGDPVFDQLYTKAEQLDVPLAVHAGGTDYLGFDRFFDRGDIEILCLSHGFGQMIQMVSVMMSGVFDRFPRLRMGFMEAGVGWLPWLSDRMDAQYESRGIVQAPDLKRRPSEYLQQGNVFFHLELKEASSELFALLRAKLGRDDILMYASDLPHEPPHEINEDLREFTLRSDVEDATKRNVLSESAKRFYEFSAVG